MKNDGATITLRISKRLRDEIKSYADARGTTVTQLTLDHYRRLLAAESQQEAEQI